MNGRELSSFVAGGSVNAAGSAVNGRRWGGGEGLSRHRRPGLGRGRGGQRCVRAGRCLRATRRWRHWRSGRRQGLGGRAGWRRQGLGGRAGWRRQGLDGRARGRRRQRLGRLAERWRRSWGDRLGGLAGRRRTVGRGRFARPRWRRRSVRLDGLAGRRRAGPRDLLRRGGDQGRALGCGALRRHRASPGKWWRCERGRGGGSGGDRPGGAQTSHKTLQLSHQGVGLAA